MGIKGWMDSWGVGILGVFVGSEEYRSVAISPLRCF